MTDVAAFAFAVALLAGVVRCIFLDRRHGKRIARLERALENLKDQHEVTTANLRFVRQAVSELHAETIKQGRAKSV